MSFPRIPRVIFVLGGPGAGKGTQCQKIETDFGFKHLSAGDLLREERRKVDSEFREVVDRFMVSGKIVPAEITCKLLENAMFRLFNTTTFLIDGFPRNRDNVNVWTKELSNKTKLLSVLVLDCPMELCVKRCLIRGAEGSGRFDDNKKMLEKRIVLHQEETVPIIEYYQQKKLARLIDSTRPVDDVYREMKQFIEEII